MKMLFTLGVVCALSFQEQRPVFRAATDVLVVETQVVDSEGRPHLGLGPEAFQVTIGGKKRSVVSADLIRYVPGDSSGSPSAPAVSNRPGVPTADEGRLFVIAVDEHSFTDKNLLPMLQQAHAFLDKLQPPDHVAVYGFPTGRTFVEPTRDRSKVRAALGPGLGASAPPESRFHMSPSEIIDVSAGDTNVVNQVVERECNPMDKTCPTAVIADARALGSYLEAQARQSLNGLKALFASLTPVPGRKTVVLLSGGLLSADRIGARPNVSTPARDTGKLAAEANASLYIIHADSHFADAMSVQRGKGLRAPSIRDTAQMAEGLEFVAGAANGHLINVSAGTAEYAFDRVLRETSAFYILGVATEPADRDGKVHFISVKVAQPSGVKVRHRLSILIK